MKHTDVQRSNLSEPSIKHPRQKATKCSQTMNVESMKNDSSRNKASDFYSNDDVHFFQNVRRM